MTATPTPTPTPNPNANPKACGLLEFAVDSRADSLAAASREGGAAPLLLWAVEPDTKARKDGNTAMAGTAAPLPLELTPRCQARLAWGLG